MLFLFRGHNGPVIRATAGALMLVVGIAVHGAVIFAGIGAVLLVWGGVGALSSQRARRQGQAGSNGRAS
jgi:hypothetical protein